MPAKWRIIGFLGQSKLKVTSLVLIIGAQNKAPVTTAKVGSGLDNAQCGAGHDLGHYMALIMPYF